MKYQIIKKYYRDKETMEVKHYFQVQYLGRSFNLIHFFGNLKWKPVKKIVWVGYDIPHRSRVNADFETEEEARQFLDNIQSPVYADEIVV